jgi:myosin heavy subunit
VSRLHRDDVLRTLSAILWLGNMSFIEVSDEVSAVEDREILQYVADLLQVDAAALEAALVTRRITTGTGEKAETFIKPNTIAQSDLHRDTLAKALYSKLFDFMVKLINDALKIDTSKPKKKKSASQEAEDSLEEEQKGEEAKKGMYIAVLDVRRLNIEDQSSTACVLMR